MWLDEIERRWKEGYELEGIMEKVAKTAVSWYANATSGLWPKDRDNLSFVQELLQTMDIPLPEPAGKLSHGEGGV